MDMIFYDYENMLIGNAKTVGVHNFYGADAGGANQQKALSCIRYALEVVLGWDEEECVQKFDEYMIRIMKLERIADYIIYPDEVPVRDPRFILSLLYPDRVRINYPQLCISMYKSVLDKERQFPREYFAGANGYYRYCICLRYLINNYHPAQSTEELYSFLTSAEGNRFLSKYRLKVPSDHLKIRVVDCVHEITRNDENSEFLFKFYSFMDDLKKVGKEPPAEEQAAPEDQGS